VKNQSKKSCRKLTLEEEYAFEHKARIKAEDYISELWEMHAELENEVNRLQSIINNGKYPDKEKKPLKSTIGLNKRIKQITDCKETTENNLSKIIRRTFK
tara:strand:- start:25384 stop:25683 length:300 start_codon:yes stop_codon:yes gene_type:complete